MLCKIENTWLGGWKGILLGDRKDANYDLRVKEIVEKFCIEIKEKYGMELLTSTVEVRFRQCFSESDSGFRPSNIHILHERGSIAVRVHASHAEGLQFEPDSMP